jgi:hypothetical protein
MDEMEPSAPTRPEQPVGCKAFDQMAGDLKA